MRVLVTGGAGYIGSHTVRRLAARNDRVVTFDNLSEGHREAVVAGDLETGDLGDESRLEELFSRGQFDAVVHFASRCYVGESMENPRRYYEENVGNALNLLRIMLRHGVRKLVFSSTCATYGNPESVPISEDHPQHPVNPYGESKYFIERILRHYRRAYGLGFAALRYFNAAGASSDSRIGESHDPETHLIPLVLQAVLRKRKAVTVFGRDYPTPDGTCIRDYIHVDDLADAHIRALDNLAQEDSGQLFLNLGTGQGYSVKQIIDTAREVTGAPIPFEWGEQRAGDPPELVADPSRARRVLGWRPDSSDLKAILETAWRWEKNRRY